MKTKRYFVSYRYGLKDIPPYGLGDSGYGDVIVSYFNFDISVIRKEIIEHLENKYKCKVDNVVIVFFKELNKDET